jgi:carbon monoxide dehydrogenase subunit G
VQLENSFTVPVPVDEAWRVLLDIERIAPCMPGAALDSVSGDEFTGRVKVKLGPINLTYQGKAAFVEKDEAAHRAVIDARGKDQRGNGTAAATITAKLAAEGSNTRVDVLTDLNITGRPAQFGRGVMTDVGNKLLGQFADKLAAQLAAPQPESESEPEPAAAEPGPAATAAATASGAVEEIAASAEQVPGDGVAAKAVKKTAAAAKKAAAAATDKTTEIATEKPAKKAAPAKAAADTTVPIKAAPAPAEPAAGAAAAAGATPSPAAAAMKPPSGPPSGPTAPPTRPATGGPARSTPSAAPRPQVEPEPIDLLEVAGGAAMTRLAAPVGGVALLIVLIALLLRRRRQTRLELE